MNFSLPNGVAVTLVAAVALAVPLATAAQESQVRAVAVAWPALLDGADVDGIMDLFTTDVVFSHPRFPAIVGKDSLKVFVEEVFRQQSAAGTSFEIEAVQVSGNWAHLVGRLETVWTNTNEGSRSPERARYLWVLRRDATGAWRVRSFVFYPIT